MGEESMEGRQGGAGPCGPYFNPGTERCMRRHLGHMAQPLMLIDAAPTYPSLKPDEVETLYTWGNTGPCVDIFAPGVDIFAACASDARCGRVTDGTYTWASGTSMAVRGRPGAPRLECWPPVACTAFPGIAPPARVGLIRLSVGMGCETDPAASLRAAELAVLALLTKHAHPHTLLLPPP